MRPVAVLLCSSALLSVAAVRGASGQAVAPGQPRLVTHVDVVARTVYLDVLDEKGKPVADVTVDMLKVVEDGVAAPVLEVRPRATAAATGKPAAPAPVPPEPAASAAGALPPPRRYAVVALDPFTLGRNAWIAAIEHLSAAADDIAAIGPVDVVALTTPPRTVLAGSRDAAEIRAALARVAAEVAPLDRFYFARSRAIRDLQAIFDDPAAPTTARGPTGAARAAAGLTSGGCNDETVVRALTVVRELAADEESLLRESIGRLQSTMVGAGRPLVALWAAQGDPDTWGFAQSLLPAWLTNAQRLCFTDTPLGSMTRLETTWEKWARDGVTVVSWSREGEALVAVSGAEYHQPLRGKPMFALGAQPLTLFQSVAETTGGALVRTEAEMRTALATVGGRFELVYQSDNAAAGWRELRVEVTRPGWTARTSPRQFVPAAVAPEAPPLELRVAITAIGAPSEQQGKDRVQLPISVDLAPLRQRLAPGAEARLLFRVLATPPGGRQVAREVEVRVPSLPEEGVLRYETALVVPHGTSGYAVEVREETSGARGAAGPVDAGPAPEATSSGDTAAAPGAFTETREVRIGQARFLMPAEGAPPPESIRVVWKKREQSLVRVVGGAGSSLELGVAIDVSKSVADERAAFTTAAAAAAARLLAPGDRVFRVDFGTSQRYLGDARGGPGTLFAGTPDWPPEKTAVFDALSYSLGRFAGKTDRAALIVFTDGCETAGRTDWRAVLRQARELAIPVFVVMVDSEPCIRQNVYKGDPLDDLGMRVIARRPTATETRLSNTSRWALKELAGDSGGELFSLRGAGAAEDVWSAVERALARVWVAVFEPSDPAVDGRVVEVRSAAGALLRPAG